MHTYIHVHTYIHTYMHTCIHSITYIHGITYIHTYIHTYMKIHVPSMLAIGVDKHTQQTNKQPQWLHLTLEHPLWLRKIIIINHNGLEK